MYEKTNWVNGETPLNADNMNKIENELADHDSSISRDFTRINTLEDDMTMAKSDIEDLTSKVTPLEADVKKNTTDIVKINNKLPEIDSKQAYNGTIITDGLDVITDKKSFYKFFYSKRNGSVQNWVIEGGTDKPVTNESIITALGGFPDGFKRKQHWFLLINTKGNNNGHLSNGFMLEIFLRGSVENDFYLMYMHSYNGTNGTYDSGWVKQANAQAGGGDTVTGVSGSVSGQDLTITVSTDKGDKVSPPINLPSGGGGSGGTYIHNIVIKKSGETSTVFYFNIINSDSSPIPRDRISAFFSSLININTTALIGIFKGNNTYNQYSTIGWLISLNYSSCGIRYIDGSTGEVGIQYFDVAYDGYEDKVFNLVG